MIERDPRVDPVAGDVTECIAGVKYTVTLVNEYEGLVYYTSQAEGPDYTDIETWREASACDSVLKRGDA